VSTTVGGISVPDPGFYSSGSLPWGIGAPLAAGTPAPATGVNVQALQNEYKTLQQQDTAELLYASFLTPEQGLVNANNVLQQAAQLQDEQLAAQQQARLANAQAGVTGDSSSTGATPASDVSNLPSVSSLLARSDAAAQSVLSAYAKGPAGSSILDFQA
jgi:NAD(P)H-dependent flavin oxidoreductase YrpB (nitropropane dioxygenase family)